MNNSAPYKHCSNETLTFIVEQSTKEQQNRRIANMCRDNEFMGQRKRNYDIATEEAVIAMGLSMSNIDEQVYGDKKPMKATLIFDQPQGTLTERHVTIDLMRGDVPLSDNIATWCIETGCAPRRIEYVHYDGMLFEYTSKPVLAEVGTGIEI